MEKLQNQDLNGLGDNEIMIKLEQKDEEIRLLQNQLKIEKELNEQSNNTNINLYEL